MAFLFYGKINYEGQKFGKLTVLKEGEGLFEGKKKRRSVICECDCGNQKEVLLRQIKRGKLKSCGCLAQKEINFNIGDIIGFWTVVGDGKEREVISSILNTGKSSSCCCKGAPKKEKVEKIIPQDTEEEKWKQSVNYPEYYISSKSRLFHYNTQTYTKQKKKHGKINLLDEMYITFISRYDTSYLTVKGDMNLESLSLTMISSLRRKYRGRYNSIIKRCYDKNNKSYSMYGGKGIIIDEDMNTFDKFIKWLIDIGIKDNTNLEIDRIDSNGNYSINNCRLVSKYENILKIYNLTVEDLSYIKSKDFDLERDKHKYSCSDNVLYNIINNKSFNNEKYF